MGGGKGGTSTSTVSIPQDVLNRYNNVNAYAQQVAQRPFQQYGGQYVAPVNATQMGAIENTTAAANQAQPYYGAATNQLVNTQNAYQPYQQAATQQTLAGLASAQPYQNAATSLAAGASGAVNAQPLDIGTYMNPYLNTVLGSTASLLNQNNQQAQAGQLGTAIRSGAFGGDRAGIAAANLAQQQNLANANIYSNIASQGFNTALGAAQQQQGVNLGAEQANRAALLSASGALQGLGQQGYSQQLGAAQQLAGLGQQGYNVGANTATTLAGLGAGAQAASLQGAQAQLAAGTLPQQTQQAQDTALYNTFLQQQSYPFQVAQFLANIAEGTGSLSGSTTTTNTVQNGIFSDKRLKEDIKPIGKTYDGQTIYSYRYKGEKHTEIGLLAQEVEKKHPEAVGLAGGYKTVHYDKATDDAAERGHFAYGGVPGMGGAGLGGSGYDPGMTAQLMANYQAMYGPLLAHQGAGGLGASGIVPPSSSGGYTLHPAEANVPQGPGVADTVNSFAKAGQSVKGLIDKFSKNTPAGGAGLSGGETSAFNSESAGDAVKSAEDKLGDATSDIPDEIPLASGGVVPYGDSSDGLDIPDDEKHYELQTPGANVSGVGGQGGGLKGAADTVGSIANAALSIGKLFSDKRAKEHIRAVGKTFDGQTVYSYRYKGDDTPRMGLIAQEVEKHHPDAVGIARGLKTVNYAKATDKAAKRGHFATGGTPMLQALRDAISPYGHDPLLPAIGTEDSEGDQDAPEAGLAQSKPDDSSKATNAPASTVTDKIKDAAAPVAGSPEHIASLIQKAEGTAKNPKSSAVGPFQILNGTLRANAAAVDPALAKTIAGMSDAELTAYRTSHPELAEKYQAIGQKITQDNYNALENAGITPTAGNVYLAHFLGTAAAKKLLGADPNTPVEDLVSPAAIKANASVLAGKTAADVAKWADKRMSSMETKRAAGGRMGYADGSTVIDPTDDATPDDSAPDGKRKPSLLFPDTVAKSPDVSAALSKALNQPIVQTGDQSDPAMGQVPVSLSAAQNGMTPDSASVPDDIQAPQARIHKPGLLDTVTHGQFVSGLGRGDASSWIPLLAGVGALASTQTNNPLTALAAGLGAGAQAAQGQREFGLMQQHTANETVNVQAGAAQRRAQALRELEGAYGDAIGNADKMQALAINTKALVQKGVLTPDDLEYFPALKHFTLGDVSSPILGGMPSTGGVAPSAPILGPSTVPSAAPSGLAPPTGQAPAPAGQVPAAKAPESLATSMPSLLKPTPALDTPKPAKIATPYDNPVNPGDGLYRDFYQKDPAYQNYAQMMGQVKSIRDQLSSNPLLLRSSYGATLAKQADDLEKTATTYRADAESRARAQVEPNAAQIRNVAANNRNFAENQYQRIANATQSVARALQTHEVNSNTPEIANLVGNVASLGIPVPDSLRELQGGSDVAGLNKAYLTLMNVGQSDAAARAQGAEIGVLTRNGAVHGGPHAAYDMAVKTRALADQKNDYANAFNKAAPMMVNEPEWTSNWFKAHPLDGYLHDTVQNTPFAKGMTAQEVTSYLPPAETRAALQQRIQSGDKYVNYKGVPYAVVRDKNGVSLQAFGGR